MANILIVRDSDGRDFDTLYSYPKAMTAAKAVEIADAAILAVKEHNPDEYDYRDLNQSLADWGIKPVEHVIYTGEAF